MPKAPKWLDEDIREFYPTCQGNIRAIQRAITERRGIEPKYMTLTDHLKRLGLERPRDKSKKAPRETPMSVDETPVEVLEGQGVLLESDTPSEVYTDAVGEFYTLPAGYAQVIQPMREYTEAEDAALKESVRLFGFIGAIVRDQYGRILDGNQRSRVAHWFGKGCPYTITEVRDDAHAMEIAAALNIVRRQYTQEERERIAPAMREQGFSYRKIAEGLGVSHTQARADVGRGAAKVDTQTLESTFQSPRVSTEIVKTRKVESTFQSPEDHHVEPAPSPQEPPKRVNRKGGGTYPAQRPTTIGKGQAEETRERMGERGQPNHNWINVLSQAHRLCSGLKRLSDIHEVLESWGVKGRQKAIDYLEPLADDCKQLLSALHAIDAQPLPPE
jgi:hypothetical protein